MGQDAFSLCTNLMTVNMLPTSAPSTGSECFNANAATLHIVSGATGYNVVPWTNTNIFATIIADL